VLKELVVAHYAGDIPEGKKKKFRAELAKFTAVINTESQQAINTGRELEYHARDPLNRYRYTWGIRRDHRTTPQCLEIAQRVEEEKQLNREKGVRLDRLKSIVREVALKYDPDYPYRDWVPHYNCRSSLRRVVL